ncbi:hypothetical protein FKM82_005434 [Ascaphus truei]
MMNRQYKQLEGRLDEMLSRIARETEEIKDLEQQLTEGQIAANEALKRDLEGIISGLQDYLESVKGQAKQAHRDCRELQSEKEALLQRLADVEEERNQLELVAMDAENMRKELAELERCLQEQHELNESLRQAQGDLSAYEAELEAQLKVRDAEANQLKEELERRQRLGQMEHSALQAELAKDKQALENALTKAQLSEEKGHENKKLLYQLKQLQGDNNFLNEQLSNLQGQLDHAVDNMIHPGQVTARVAELKRKLQTGVGEIRCTNASDILGQNLADLQKQINEILAKSQEEKKEAQDRQRKLQEEMATLQDKAREAPEDYKRACNKAAETRMQSEKRQYEAKVRQLENENRRLNGKMKGLEEIQGLADQQLQEADEEREKLLTELQDLEKKRTVEDAQAQRQLFGLDKELKDLKRAMAISDKMATSELSLAKDQLKSLHGTVLKLNNERAGEMQEAENFCSQTAQAIQDLGNAEAEIELLQNILKDREKQLHDEMQNADAGITTSNYQQLEIDKLNHTLKKQRAEIERLKHLLDHAKADNIGEMDKLLDEIASLRHALFDQNDYITGMADPFRRKGYWYYVPPPSNVSGPDSLSTKDSGIGLQYPITSSPARRRAGHIRHSKKEESEPPTRGHWVYSPFRSGLHRWHSNRDGGDGEDGEAVREASVPSACHFVPPPGSVIYTVLPGGASAPQGTVMYGPPPPSSGTPCAPGTVVYGPPPVGTQIVYGPPPPHFTIPLIPTGVHHCNVPEHHALEKEVTRLEDIVENLKSRRHTEKKAKERLQKDIQELEHQKEVLRREVEELRMKGQKHKRKDFVEGHLDSLITELELEKSLQHHDDIVDEIECIEKTLVKRRAELREADRLLAEAEAELQNTRAKTTDTIEKYSAAKKHLSHTESDAEELERRAQETAVQLVKADQQLRIMQVNARDLEQHKLEQESILKEINGVVSARDSEFQSLTHKIEKMSDNLQKLQDDVQVAEGKEDHHLQTLKEAENILQEKKVALERLNDQVCTQQQEMIELDRFLGQKKEELHLLQDHIDQMKVELKEVLREGELDVAERRQEIRELKSLVEDLSVQKGELNAQLSEKRAQLVILKQEAVQEEDNLQRVAAQINKHKSELKHVLEMLQLENNELQGLTLQHDQKVNEMERTQSTLLEGKMELENLQRTSQRLHGEVEWQRQLLERDHKEIELLMTQMHSLQDSVESLSNEKKLLEECSQDLKKKLAQAKKVLEATEDCNKAATSNLEKLESDIKMMQKEIEQLNNQKQPVRQETATIQQILQEKKEELGLLKDEIVDSRDELKLIEQDLRNTTRHRDDLLREQAALKEDIGESTQRCKQLQEKEDRKLKQLQRATEEKEQELTKQEMLLKQIIKDIECEEEQLKESTAKLKDHKQAFEWELANRQNTLELMSSKVNHLEERALKLQQEEKGSSALEETLRNTRHQLSETEQQLQEKTNELLAKQKQMDIYDTDISRLQDQLTSERKKDEKRIAVLKEAIKSQRIQLERTIEEQKHENSSLQKQVISVEQVAYDNHERAKRLLKELKQLQAEHLELRKQLKSQEELHKRQQEVNEAVRTLKTQVKMEIQSSLKDFNCSDHRGLLENVEAVLEEKESLKSQLESLKENFPFTANEASKPSCKQMLGMSKAHVMDEHWRGDALREKLRQHEDRLKAQLRHCMSKQADVLSKGKQQTEGSLHSLKKQVDALDDLVSNTSSDTPFHAHNSSGVMHSVHEAHCHQSQSSIEGIKRSQSMDTIGITTQSRKINTFYSHGICP